MREFFSKKRSEKILHDFFWALVILATITAWGIVLAEEFTEETRAWVIGSEFEYGSKEHMTMFANQYGEGWRLIY